MYGEKCIRCQHVRHDGREAADLWTVFENDGCTDCWECQRESFVKDMAAHLDLSYFDSEVRDAVRALEAGRPHHLIDKLRAEIALLESDTDTEWKEQG